MSESENTYSNEKNLYKLCHLLKTRRAETVTDSESRVIQDFICLFNNSSNSYEQLGGGIRENLSSLWNRTKDAFTGKQKLFDIKIEKVEISKGNIEEGNIEEGNIEEGNIEEGDNKGSIASGGENENVAVDFLKCFIDSPIQNEENDSDIKLDLDIYFCKLENSDLDIKIQSKLYKQFLNKYEEHEYLHDILKIIKLDSFNCDIIIAKTNDTWVPDFITTKFNLNNNLQKKLLNAVKEYRKERNDLYKSKYFDLTYNELTNENDSTDENVDIIKSIALNKEHIEEFDKNIKEIYVNFGNRVKEVIIRIKKHIYKSLTENDTKIQLHCANDKAKLKKEEEDEDEEEDGEASSSFKASPESFSVEYGHNYIPVVPNKVAPDAEVVPVDEVVPVAPLPDEDAPPPVAPPPVAPPPVAPPPVAPPPVAPPPVAPEVAPAVEVAPAPEVAPPEVAPAPAEVAPAPPPKELIGGRKNNKKSKRKPRGKPKRKTRRNQ